MAAGVATNSKGHVFVYTRNTDPIMRLGWQPRLRAWRLQPL